MASAGTKRVYVYDIQSDMVLSEDVTLKNGVTLMPRDTMLNAMNVIKLVDYKIDYVFVKDTDARVETKPIQVKEQKELLMENIPIIEREDFKAFELDYEKKTESTKKVIKDIGNGANLKLQDLFELTNGLVQNMECKTDVFRYVSAMKTTNEHTYTHSNNVSMLCHLFSQWLGFSQEEMMELTVAGMLHDVGKTKISNDILNKPGKLTDEEFETMKSHTTLGYWLIEKLDIPKEVKMAALMHHEKIDGTGYPLKVKGANIGKYARIVAICDIYDAMTTNRVYRKKICPFDVIKTFECKTYGELDTSYLLTFLNNIAYSYMGSRVILSDEREAEVMFINKNNLSKPIVRTSDDIIDLSTNKNITIDSIKD